MKKQHAKALRLSKVRAFVLYSLRHTMQTRLGESGCDTWTLARIAGHSNIRISQRYVHPSDEHVLSALQLRQGGDKSARSNLGFRRDAGNRSGLSVLSGGQCRTRTCGLLLVRQAL